jgi:hypothetical protein
MPRKITKNSPKNAVSELTTPFPKYILVHNYTNVRYYTETSILFINGKLSLIAMEELGEQYTVVFALIVIEPAKRGRAVLPPPPTWSVPLTIYAKTTGQCCPDSSIVIAKSHFM